VDKPQLKEERSMEHGKQNPHIKSALAVTPEDYMVDRVIYKIEVYTKLGHQMKFRYQLTSIVGIACAAIVPALINLSVNRVVPTILSLVVTILVSLEKLFHFREHWRNYDAIAALLRSEQIQFQTNAGPYKGKPDDQAFELFVERIEKGLSEERSDTIGMRTSEMEKL
jgi:hypothetical protein